MKPGHVPLERALSKLGIASRTQARAWILEGRVQVEGKVIKNPLHSVFPERARITVGDEKIQQQSPVTILLHKPKGVVTTRSDEKGRPTVYSCLQGLDSHVIPVGRLDFATTGLLLLTNDTRFSAWVTEPTHAVIKTYQVTVRGEVTLAQAEEAMRGVSDRNSKGQVELLRAQEVAIEKSSGRESQLTVMLTEGKNREIRRLFLALGHEVTRLKRVAFGSLMLGNLKPGEWRRVEIEELVQAFPTAPIRR